MSFIRLYADALLHDGAALMGGSLGIIFTFLAAYFAFVVGHNIAALWVLALFSIAFASYRVWAKERRALLAEQAKNAGADIQGEIREVFLKEQLTTMPASFSVMTFTMPTRSRFVFM